MSASVNDDAPKSTDPTPATDGSKADATPATAPGAPTTETNGNVAVAAETKADAPASEAPKADDKPAETTEAKAEPEASVAAPAEAAEAAPQADAKPAEEIAKAEETAKAEEAKADEAKVDEKPAEATKEASKPEPAAEPLPKVVVRIAGATDVGRIREHNEDNYLLANLTTHSRGEDVKSKLEIEKEGLLFAVCDGMGGALAGEVASQMAVDVIHGIVQDGPSARDRDHFAQKLVASVQEAGARIFLAAKTNRDRHGMGTTSTVAGVHGSTLFVGQVGDSRAYLYRRGRLKQITKDQSLVSKLIEAGQLTEEQAESYEHAHIILQALGTADTVSVDLSYVELRQGDAVMLCSDGLSGLATHDQIREALAEEDDPATCCQRLIDAACDAGGHDNVTVIVVRFEGELPEATEDDEGLGYQPYVLSESVDPLVAGRASSSLKLPDMPPPGSDVKNARSLPPDLSIEGSIAALFEPIPGLEVEEKKPAARSTKPDRSAPSPAPLSVPMQQGSNTMSWLIVAAVVLGVIVAAVLLSRRTDPSAQPGGSTVTISPTVLGDAAPVTAVDPAQPVAPTRIPEPAWGDAGGPSADRP